MYITVRHTITNPQKWEQTTKHIMALSDQDKLPPGLKGLMYLPSLDGRQADCVWAANSLETLRLFLDRETAGGAKNEYFQINETAAFGLPGHAELSRAA